MPAWAWRLTGARETHMTKVQLCSWEPPGLKSRGTRSVTVSCLEPMQELESPSVLWEPRRAPTREASQREQRRAESKEAAVGS